MSLREKIAESTGITKNEIPGSYQILGEILLMKFMAGTKTKTKLKIAEAAMETIKSVKSVYEQKPIMGELRKPSVRFLAGIKNTKTIHTEHGILYSIDVSKIMFSKGNLLERQRIISQVKRGEIIVDMFAGIGYFSLGIAKFSEAKEIVAIEKNPDSFGLLKENITLNRVSNITAILEDCRKISSMKEFRGAADRIIMGYLPGTGKFLPHAFGFLGNKGIIHYHDTFKENELWAKPVGIIKSNARKKGFSVKIIAKRTVKSYAPRVWHVVIDFEASRNHSA